MFQFRPSPIRRDEQAVAAQDQHPQEGHDGAGHPGHDAGVAECDYVLLIHLHLVPDQFDEYEGCECDDDPDARSKDHELLLFRGDHPVET